MATRPAEQFTSGVIEGFYGKPWSQAERLTLFAAMAAWGLNTYVYAPKDDLKHRATWRELYTSAEAQSVGELIQACRRRNLRFIYALAPGLDLRYSAAEDLARLQERIAQTQSLGGEHFALLFDDIPDQLDGEDLRRWGSLAAAQCHVANALFRWMRERSPAARFLFCPTPYCGRMAQLQVGGAGYLEVVGRELSPGIDVFWTGPEIISREIPIAHIRELQSVLRRRPLIWDNLHANDYDGRRFFCGPYSGRPPALRSAVSGLLSNPNCEFSLNFVPLRTLAEFVRSPESYAPRAAYLAAMREWWPHFVTVGKPLAFEDLVLLGDCFYLPHEEGAEAEDLCRSAADLLARNPADGGDQVAALRQRVRRLREVCVRLTTLRDRSLFHALSRRVWELGEELEMLERCLAIRSVPSSANRASGSDLGVPEVYGGGMISRLQRLFVHGPDGRLVPAARGEPKPVHQPARSNGRPSR